MNRRNFLRSLGLLSAAAATPKLIFDLGANSHLYKLTGLEWVSEQMAADPFRRVGHFYTVEDGELVNMAFLKAPSIIAQEIIDVSVKDPYFWANAVRII